MRRIAITNYEDLYEVSNTGLIYSLDRVVLGKDGKLYPHPTKLKHPTFNPKLGYFAVDLYNQNQRKKHYVHRLVAEAFIPNPDNKPEINHRDSNRQNNQIGNLEWVTSSENSQHAYNQGFATQKHRRQLTETEYKTIYHRFIAGESLTKIIINFPIQLPRCSVNLKKLVLKWGLASEYREAIQQQRIARAQKNGNPNKR